MDKYLQFLRICNTLRIGDDFTIKNMLDEEELDFFLKLEREWRQTQKNSTFYELIEEFPEAKYAARLGITNQINHRKEIIKNIQDRHQQLVDEYCRWVGVAYSREMKEILDEDANKKIDELQEEIKLLTYQKRFLVGGKKTEDSYRGASREMIERARAFPIDQLVKVRKDGKLECIKHSERTPSMHHYKKGNNLYCFSCGVRMDSIDVVMETRKVGFVEAVKILCN